MSWGAVALTFVLIAFVVTAYLRPTLPAEPDETQVSPQESEPPAR